jgi:inorganic pyrophosphatase
MRDEKGIDDKIIAVSSDPAFSDYTTHTQLPGHTLREIKRFFEDYKTLENKQTIIEPFRIKSVEAIKFTHREEREAALARPATTCSCCTPRTCSSTC